MNNKIKITCFCLFLILFFYTALPVSALDPKFQLVQCTGKQGACSLTDFGTLLARIADLILGISGSLALAFFVYGGFIWLTSSGNKERVAKGKNVLLAATIGLVIVFIAYTAVELTIKSLTGSTEFNFFKQGPTPWQKLPK